MKITIEAEHKEIADLIVALQGQHISRKTDQSDDTLTVTYTNYLTGEKKTKNIQF